MGTNFYWKVGTNVTPTGESISIHSDDPAIHIGKRSAAGLYCWDCRVTLCEQGEAALHRSGSTFSETCPKCGRSPDKDGHNAAMVELGFQAPAAEVVQGVRSCSSFSWAQDPLAALTAIRRQPDEALIEDEYGHEYTGRQFLDMLEFNCPVQKTDSIGEWFC